jgi:hypothetical protein
MEFFSPNYCFEAFSSLIGWKLQVAMLISRDILHIV